MSYGVEAGVSGCAVPPLYSDPPVTHKSAVPQFTCPYQFILIAPNLVCPQWVPRPGLLYSRCAIMLLMPWFSVLGVLGLRSGGVTITEAFGPGNVSPLVSVTYAHLIYPLTHLISLE